MTLAAALTAGVAQAEMGAKGARYDADGALLQPQGFREWVFIGAPLTPNALNGSSAAFPELRHVYVEPSAYAAFKRNGRFPEGTVIAKELVLTEPGTHKDGSRAMKPRVVATPPHQTAFTGWT
jgi:hypothetical protein